VDGTIVFSLLNGTQVFAQFVVGVASDKFKFSPVVIAAVSSLVSASFLVLWLYARSFAALLAFAIMFGFFAGGYSVLWPRLNISLTADKDTQLFLYGYLALGRGVGNIIAIAFSVFLMDDTGHAAQDPISAFRGMILLALSVLFISGLISTISLAMSWLRTRRTKSLMSSTSSLSQPSSTSFARS
jgi:MFS family permease